MHARCDLFARRDWIWEGIKIPNKVVSKPMVFNRSLSVQDDGVHVDCWSRSMLAREEVWTSFEVESCGLWWLLGHGDLRVLTQRAQATRVSNVLTVVKQGRCLWQHDAWQVRVEMMARIPHGWCCEFGGHVGCAWGMETHGAARCNSGALGCVCSGHGVMPKIGWPI